MSGKIVMIGSMKGGVSKTVTTFNLAYSLSKLGKKVLAVDFDSQANLSTCLGVEDVATVPVTIGNLMLAQIEEEELRQEMVLILFHLQWFYLWLMQSFVLKWDRKRCFQIYWKHFGIRMITFLSTLLHHWVP